MFGQKEEEAVPAVQEKKEEIPTLAPIVPVQTEVPSSKDKPTTATSDKRQRKRGPNKPKARGQVPTDQTAPPSTERKKTQGPKQPKGPSGLPPKPQDDGFEQVVRKQATRGRGGARGAGERGRGRGRGGGRGGPASGAVVNGEGK